ncbi:MAG: methylenetetrahydrofolate reductase [Oscillospiraceae bacterium]
MKITEMLSNKCPVFSFEVFPPKNDAPFEPVKNAVHELSKINPDFISVTYGAGGGTSNNTLDIASYIQNELGNTALAHLTCASSSQQEICNIIDMLKANNINNILALRGDVGADSCLPKDRYYEHSYQLINEIKSRGDFCIGGACYPEGHVECENKSKDMDYLKQKVDCGADFLVTQMFFDNNVLYSFLYRTLANNINIPVFAGVMPVTNSKQIKRICQLSGTSLSPRFKSIVDKFGDNPLALKQAGIAYATEQIIDLVSNGVKGIHLYTMNKPEVAQKIRENLSEIL